MIVNIFDPEQSWAFNWFTSLCKQHNFKFLIKGKIADPWQDKVVSLLAELSKITNYHFFYTEYADIIVDIPDEQVTYIKLKHS